MADQFLLPKDPRLSFGMLFPSSKRNHPHASVSGSQTHYLFWGQERDLPRLARIERKAGRSCNTAATSSSPMSA
jgi:hypothetical protein